MADADALADGILLSKAGIDSQDCISTNRQRGHKRLSRVMEALSHTTLPSPESLSLDVPSLQEGRTSLSTAP
jgi:hypothetical protein